MMFFLMRTRHAQKCKEKCTLKVSISFTMAFKVFHFVSVMEKSSFSIFEKSFYNIDHWTSGAYFCHEKDSLV